jgi:hypothetical protein
VLEYAFFDNTGQSCGCDGNNLKPNGVTVHHVRRGGVTG